MTGPFGVTPPGGRSIDDERALYDERDGCTGDEDSGNYDEELDLPWEYERDDYEIVY